MYKSRIIDEVKVKGILQKLHERHVDKEGIRSLLNAHMKMVEACQTFEKWMCEEEKAMHTALLWAMRDQASERHDKLERQWRLWFRT
jgi:hypothetical protein